VRRPVPPLQTLQLPVTGHTVHIKRWLRKSPVGSKNDFTWARMLKTIRFSLVHRRSGSEFTLDETYSPDWRVSEWEREAVESVLRASGRARRHERYAIWQWRTRDNKTLWSVAHQIAKHIQHSEWTAVVFQFWNKVARHCYAKLSNKGPAVRHPDSSYVCWPVRGIFLSVCL
jgi:hypothetical protein